MCILIMKRANSHISKEKLKNSFDNNNDGAGFSYCNTDVLGRTKLITYKSMDFEPFYKKLRRAENNNPESNFLIHFRIGTSGVKTIYNCHPFKVDNETVFAHNGIISSARKDPSGIKNDTQMFLEDTLKVLPKGWESNKAILDLIEGYIGASKLTFLDVDNTYLILNEQMGKWEEGVWYSNTSYKKRTTYYNYTPPKVTKKPIPINSQKKTQKQINNSSFIECDYCGTFTRVANLTPYRSFGFMEAFCKSCEIRLLDAGSLVFNEEEKLGDFISSYNTVGPQTFQDNQMV